MNTKKTIVGRKIDTKALNRDRAAIEARYRADRERWERDRWIVAEATEGTKTVPELASKHGLTREAVYGIVRKFTMT